jgi:hypothetical protein
MSSANGGFGQQRPQESCGIRVEIEASGWRSTARRSSSPDLAWTHVLEPGQPGGEPGPEGRIESSVRAFQISTRGPERVDVRRGPAHRHGRDNR